MYDEKETIFKCNCEYNQDDKLMIETDVDDDTIWVVCEELGVGTNINLLKETALKLTDAIINYYQK